MNDFSRQNPRPTIFNLIGSSTSNSLATFSLIKLVSFAFNGKVNFYD
ncbi:unnamed protein product [Schistosoma curassoni]|uniref:Uncharacterized protein n=1 Tax=Schistosoma curassoni TaxID=6186 RepID=A0A183L5D2_9TREM|nr:unnamed protein product [Schistosoma curassoni]